MVAQGSDHGWSTGQLWEGDFSRYAWCQHGGVTYEARLSNPDPGSTRDTSLRQMNGLRA